MENQKIARETDNTRKNQRKKTNFLVFLLIGFFIFYLGVAWGSKNVDFRENPKSAIDQFSLNFSNPKELFTSGKKAGFEEVDFDLFWTAWAELEKSFVDQDKMDAQEMVYGAIKGMVQSLGDPYSAFMDPKETEEFNEEIAGAFEGIGAELGMKEGILTIIAPIEGMPAEKAGIRAGDKIFKINGDLATEISVDEAVRKIRGPKGTKVMLTIVRNGEEKTQDIEIMRDKIEIKSVVYEKKENGVAYLKINKFSEDTHKEFNREVTKIIADGSRAVVLDLRNNPGGYLNVAVEIASKFVDKGEVVVWEQKRDGSKNSYKAMGGNVLSEMPMIVLLNEGSASASEILAGALRDIQGVRIIGKKSFGKGSVQQISLLDGGSSLKVTVAKWLTPKEESIHEKGLSPDVEVEISSEDLEQGRDPQLEKALEEVAQIAK